MAPRRILPNDLPPGSPLARRLAARAPAERVTVEHDGSPVVAVAGEPLAVSLLAARQLGLDGLAVFALLYGVLLCNARAMGEFGAVSVVSGHIRGQTNTMPLHIEILYNEYQFAAAFAVASLLALLALVTLVLKYAVEQRVKAQKRVAGDRAE